MHNFWTGLVLPTKAARGVFWFGSSADLCRPGLHGPWMNADETWTGMSYWATVMLRRFSLFPYPRYRTELILRWPMVLNTRQTYIQKPSNLFKMSPPFHIISFYHIWPCEVIARLLAGDEIRLRQAPRWLAERWMEQKWCRSSVPTKRGKGTIRIACTELGSLMTLICAEF